VNLAGLFSKILGFLVIIITLALSPTINTANGTIASGNLTNLIGMDVVADFGAPLIILGLLVSGGVFAVAGVKGTLGGASMGDLFKVIGSVVVIVVLLSMFPEIMTYVNDLIQDSTGFAITIYGIIPIVIYLGIIVGAGWVQVQTYRSAKKGKASTASATGM
jgi:hypothetical protein